MAQIDKQECLAAFKHIMKDIKEHPKLKAGMPYTIQRIAEHADWSTGANSRIPHVLMTAR